MFKESGRTVKIGVVGLGGRGRGWVETFLKMKDVDVIGICDIREDRIQETMKIYQQYGISYDVTTTTDYNELYRNQEIEAIVNATSWQVHHRVAIAALEAGKNVGLEVGGANSVQECWDMVRAAERSGKFCMPMANVCYGREEMTLINMVRKGLFGEVVHCEGGYGHDRRPQIGWGDVEGHYRQLNFTKRNGELYPMHAIGYISKILGINRGNRMLSLISVSSKAAGQHQWYLEHRPDTPFANQQMNQGDIVNTVIRLANGETVMLTHDCTLPRPYSRAGKVQGTKGLWIEDKGQYYLEGAKAFEGEERACWHDFEEAMAEYEPKIWKEFRESGKSGTHGGMDYLVGRAFVDTLQKDAIPPFDVYDAALWTALTCLSEDSVSTGGFVAVPDFTNGRWMDRGDDICTTEFSLDQEL